MLKKMISKLSLISKHCSIPGLLRYHTGNIIQAPLEALLTYYLFTALIIATDFFLLSPLDAPTLLKVIFIPLYITIIVCLIFSILVVYSITNALYGFIFKNKKELNNKDA